MPTSCVPRRHFLAGLGAGFVAGLPLGILGWNNWNTKVETRKLEHSPHVGMPGLYPGRVIEISNPRVTDTKYRVDRTILRAMVDRGMCELTGADEPPEAWKKLFAKDDVVGIKLNPVGRRNGRYDVAESISHKELLLETVRNLRQIGIPAQNIILFERYAIEFIQAGYGDMMTERELDGVRWCASSAAYTNEQLAIDGNDKPDQFSPELMRHVMGYDPDCFVQMGFAAPEHHSKDDRRYRSHLSAIVTRMVNKIITLPVLKDHRSAGVTLALKNMSHGMNNNVARSHIVSVPHGYPTSVARTVTSPNQCNTFIPAAVNQPLLKQKATLHILDGLLGVYEGGPGNWNKTWGTWRANSLFFATDPVAMDHVGWDRIDSKRIQVGLPRVGEMGRHLFTTDRKALMALTDLGGTRLPEALTLLAAQRFVRSGGDTEVLDRRQPEHILLAGLIGLGVFDIAQITHRTIALA